MHMVDALVFLFLLFDYGAPEILEFGNPLSGSHKALSTPEHLAILLLDFDLVNGTLREYRVNIAGGGYPLRLHVWRPLAGTSYLLVGDVGFTPFEPGTFRIYPGDNIRVQDGDKIGFLPRGPDTAIVYDFRPLSAGSLILARSFGNLSGAPVLGYTYTFSPLPYDTWRFAIAVRVDTDYGTGALPSLAAGDGHTHSVSISVTGNRKDKPVTRQNKVWEQTSPLLWVVIVIPVIYAIIAITATVYALCHVLTRNKKVVLTSFDTAGPIFHEGEWTISPKNICFHDMSFDDQTGSIRRAEVFGLAGRTGWTAVAVKTLKGRASDNDKSMFLRELAAMKSLKPNANVLQLLGCCTDNDTILMVVESVPFGNLRDYLRDLKDSDIHANLAGHTNFTLSRDLVGFAAQVARGMAYISSMSMLHRNLCARNVLLGDGRLCKISSFGFIQDIIENHEYEKVTQIPLPLRWMAPESLSGNIFTSKSDVFSLGVVIWEIITLGATPYYELDTADVIKNVKEGRRMSKPPHCDQDLYDIVVSCWHATPPERATFQQVTGRLQYLHDPNRHLVQLEKYSGATYVVLDNASFPQEVL